ncbi:MAG: hypothetical protein JEY79_07905 [Pseudodesulfovibrio sp.]|nr:hypothetical protein [Pseudodesulfovibrio sp.]
MSKKKNDHEMNEDELNGIVGGMDSISGTDGNDTLYYGDENGVVMDGSDGDDQMQSQGYTQDFMYGGDGNDTMDGGNDNDYMEGGDGDDSMIGGHGNDTLIGGDGNDVIQGGDGSWYDNDRIDGGRGDDTMSGAGGNDVFVFNRASGDDVITDFDPNNDTFEFQGIDGESELTVTTDDDGSTIINFGDATVTLQGVSLTVEEVRKLAGFESDNPGTPEKIF